MSSVRRPHARLFQIRGPAAPKFNSNMVEKTDSSENDDTAAAVISLAAPKRKWRRHPNRF